MRHHCAITLLFVWILLANVCTVEAAVLEKGKAPQVVRLGVITLYHPLEMYKQYQPFVDYISEATPYDFELQITQDYVSIIRLLCEGDIDIALLGGLTYIEAANHSCCLPFLAVLGADRKPVYQGTFITREQNVAIRNLQDIKGKRFAFASEHSTSGNLAPLYYLYARNNIRLGDFSGYKNLRYHDSVAREVLRGNYDAGVVLDSVAEKYQGKGIHILDQTEPLPGFLLVVRPGLEPKLRHSLEDILLGLDYDNPEFRAIMDHWDANIRYGFSRVTDANYDSIRQMIGYLKKQGVFLGGGNEIFSGRPR